MSRIEIEDSWLFRKGQVRGLGQSSVEGVIVFTDDSGAIIQALGDAVALQTGEDIPKMSEPLTPMQQAATLVNALGALQRYCNVYVGRRYSLRPLSSNPLAIKVTIPCAHPLITQRLLAKLSQLPQDSVNPNSAVAQQDRALHHWLAATEKDIRGLADKRMNQFRLFESADALGIPVFNIVGHIDALGSGHYSRWFESTVTDKTSGLGAALAQNKFRSAELLRKVGLPGAINRLVSDVSQALEAAHEFGFPIVVKPNDSDRGNGVSADLRSLAEIKQAFKLAKKFSPDVLVEKHVQGFTHRLTVCQGDIVLVTKRIAGGVVGDGQQTVEMLIEAVAQSTTFKRRAAQMGRAPLSLDEEARALLSREGLSSDYVPELGQYIRLRRRDNINAGGTNENCAITTVHDDNIRLAQDIATLFQLDFVGIDLLIEDISRSWQEIGGLVCEVNAKPQLRASDQPEIYQTILKKIFFTGTQIPADATVMRDGYVPSHEMIEKLSRHQPQTIFSCRSGLWLAGQKISSSFQTSYDAAVAALICRDAHSAHAFFELSDLIRNGLPGLTWRDLRLLNLDDELNQYKVQLLKELVGAQFSGKIFK